MAILNPFGDEATRVPGAIYHRDWFTGIEKVIGADDATLAEAYRAGHAGQPLEGRLFDIAYLFNRQRNEPREAACHMSEGSDNAIVDWYCQGIRDRDFEIGDPNRATLPWARGFRANWPIAMLWNLSERPALTNEADVRALIAGPQLELPAPKSAADILQIGGPKE